MANEFQDIGRDIRNAVRDAVNSGDFSALNGKIRKSVSDAIGEVNERLQGYVMKTPPQYQTPPQSRPSHEEPMQQPYRQPPAVYAKKPKGETAGLALTIAGGLLTAVFLGFFLTALSGVLQSNTAESPLLLAMLVKTVVMVAYALPLGGSLALLIHGIRRGRRIRRFHAYRAQIGDKQYCDIARLSGCTGKSEAFVRKDLGEMIRRRFFLQAHIDDEQKTLILTDEMYAQYRELKQRRAEQAAEEARRAAETDAERLLRETVEQGEHYLRVIREANDAIPGEVVSQKLYRLEEIVRRIFEQVRAVPSQIPELRRFFDYYMPTTLKLVQAYRELDAQPIAGENIMKAKTEIENTLDTINLAFENLFDSLFAHTTVDITSDISVLKTLLHQEGLTEKDFA